MVWALQHAPVVVVMVMPVVVVVVVAALLAGRCATAPVRVAGRRADIGAVDSKAAARVEQTL